MKFKSIAFIALLAGFGLAAVAEAGSVTGTYTVSSNSSNPGLVIQTADSDGSGFSTSLLRPGDSATFDLFEIWTDENQVDFDDRILEPIGVNFDISLPGAGIGTIVGNTEGLPALFPGAEQHGEVNWAGPAILHVTNPAGFIDLGIGLTNKSFNFGDASSLQPGEAYGATVQATFTLLAVPEPGVLGMFGLGLLGLGVAALRRRRSR